MSADRRAPPSAVLPTWVFPLPVPQTQKSAYRDLSEIVVPETTLPIVVDLAKKREKAFQETNENFEADLPAYATAVLQLVVFLSSHPRNKEIYDRISLSWTTPLTARDGKPLQLTGAPVLHVEYLFALLALALRYRARACSLLRRAIETDMPVDGAQFVEIPRCLRKAAGVFDCIASALPLEDCVKAAPSLSNVSELHKGVHEAMRDLCMLELRELALRKSMLGEKAYSSRAQAAICMGLVRAARSCRDAFLRSPLAAKEYRLQAIDLYLAVTAQLARAQAAAIMASDCNDAGEAVAYLRKGLPDEFEKDFFLDRRARESMPVFLAAAQDFNACVGALFERATKDNQTVYFATVPDSVRFPEPPSDTFLGTFEQFRPAQPQPMAKFEFLERDQWPVKESVGEVFFKVFFQS